MIYLVFIIFGLLPSIIWLLFYLRKDAHPESKKSVLKIFFFGMIAAFLAMNVELWLFWLLDGFWGDFFKANSIAFFLVLNFVIVALVEEFSKYLVVRSSVVKDKEFDEPVDAMIYIIISALGFAALENVLILFTLGPFSLVRDAAFISSFRFLGATFLHVLASGVIGYYLALSFYQERGRKTLLLKGIMIAVVLHGVFNILITMIERGLIREEKLVFTASFSLLIILLSSTAIFISKKFKELKKIKSICKLNS